MTVIKLCNKYCYN